MYKRRNEMLVRARSPHLTVLQVNYSRRCVLQLCSRVASLWSFTHTVRIVRLLLLRGLHYELAVHAAGYIGRPLHGAGGHEYVWSTYVMLDCFVVSVV
jgi:hypothetical protein